MRKLSNTNGRTNNGSKAKRGYAYEDGEYAPIHKDRIILPPVQHGYERLYVRLDIDSSWLEAADYNSKTRELVVLLKNGTTYTYADIPPNVWGAFKKAKSKGSFFSNEIKGNYDMVAKG